ncbi:MAG TPA: ABC transporter permease, partial [Acidobacteriaceae bacterium]
MTTLLNDLRYAWRQLLKAPGFAVTAVLTLALGIGISAAMFTVVDGVLLRPMPVPHSSQIVVFGEANNAGNISSSSLPDLRDWREHAKSFQDISWYTQKFFDLKKADGTAQFSLNIQTSPSFFSMLQAQPLMGRTFLPQAGTDSNQGTVVLSHFVWENNFHADKNILGKQIQLGGDTYTVIGVMPQRFYIPINDDGPMVWTVLPHNADMEQRDNGFLTGIGRLRPGVSVASARTELSG